MTYRAGFDRIFAVIAGTVFNYVCSMKSQMQDSYARFSLPDFDVFDPVYLVIAITL